MQLRNALLVLAASVSAVVAFPSAPGQCPEGIVAVGPSHLGAPSVTTGSLIDGGLSISVNGDAIPAGTAMTLPAGVEHTITLAVTGSNPDVTFFRGFLIRLGETTVSTLGAVQPVDTAISAIAGVCTGAGVGGVGHNGRVEKTTVSATVMLPSAAANMPLDVTAVIMLRNGESEYYYSSYTLSLQDGTAAPVMAPLPPSPGFPPCNVCDANDPTVRITNRDAIVEISGQDPTTCFNFQRAGDFGFIAEAFCPAVAGFLSPCDCMSQATAAPVTAAPVTAAPVTAAPVTPAPVTAAPITPAPVTSAPVTAAPATSAPVTPAPVTSAPGTAAPVTSAPVTAAPVTAAPVTGAPVTPAPVTSAPVTAAPVTTAPVTAAPVTSAPITTAPVVPATAAPVTAAPAAGEITSAPATAAPVSVAPVVSTPTAVPITVPRPPTAAPVTAAPVADKKGKKGKKEKKMKMKKDNKGKEG